MQYNVAWRSALYDLFRPTLRQVFRGWVFAVYRWRLGTFMHIDEREEHCRRCRHPFITDSGEVFCTMCEEHAFECDRCEYVTRSVMHFDSRKLCARCDPDRDSYNGDASDDQWEVVEVLT